MIDFEEKDYGKFKYLVSLTPEELKRKLFYIFYNCFYHNKVNIVKNNIIAHGNTPICLIAHLDTVFPKPTENIYCDTKQKIIWSPDGLGADDRAGIYAIFKILHETDFLPHIILTADEEQMGIGASALVETYGNFSPFVDLKYMIELDFANGKKCTFYNCENSQFKKYICEKYSFKETRGIFTDISILAPAWDIAAVNLSIGFHNAHSYTEYFNIDEFLYTVNKVTDMLKDVRNIEKIFKYYDKT